MWNLKLFFTFVKIGFLGFGGGYMMIPLFFLEIVEHHHWLTHDQVFNIVAIAQTVPGVFATNSATLIGLTIGHPGYGILATLGIVSPALVAGFMAEKYIKPHLNKPALKAVLKGLSAAVIGIILGVGINMMDGVVNSWPTALVAALSFFLFQQRRWNAATAMITSACLGVVLMQLF